MKHDNSNPKYVAGEYITAMVDGPSNMAGLYCYQILNVDYQTNKIQLLLLDDSDLDKFNLPIDVVERWEQDSEITVVKTEKELLAFRLKYS
jgi:hypothetical protein